MNSKLQALGLGFLFGFIGGNLIPVLLMFQSGGYHPGALDFLIYPILITNPIGGAFGICLAGMILKKKVNFFLELVVMAICGPLAFIALESIETTIYNLSGNLYLTQTLQMISLFFLPVIVGLVVWYPTLNKEKN